MNLILLIILFYIPVLLGFRMTVGEKEDPAEKLAEHFGSCHAPAISSALTREPSEMLTIEEKLIIAERLTSCQIGDSLPDCSKTRDTGCIDTMLYDR